MFLVNQKQTIIGYFLPKCFCEFCFRRCHSGDYTLEAVENAIEQIMNDNSDGDESDEYIVVAISDANLARYGIHPRELGKVSCSRVGFGK